jgi:hypothetical protein
LKSVWQVFPVTEDKEKEEITVKAPSKPVVSPEKKAERTLEKSLEEERFDLLHVSNEFGAYFGIAVVAIGILLLSLFAFVSVSGQAGLLVLSSESTIFSMFLWLFAGLLNIIGGFLLIGSEG